MSRLRQPLLGVLASGLVIVLSLALVGALAWPVFRDWVSFYLVGTVPFAFLVAVFWRGEHPRSIARLTQPWRGLAFLALTLVVALVVAWLHLVTIGGGVTPPTPFVAQCLITSVPIAFMLMTLWGGWPFSMVRSPVVGGVLLLAVAYGLNALVFRTLSDFTWLVGAPPYAESLDPQGPLSSWTVLVVLVTAMGATLLLLHLDLWPLSRWPGLMRQPVLGVVGTLLSLALALLVVRVATAVGLPVPDVLADITAPFLFGSIVVLAMLEGSALPRLSQPVRGFATAALAMLVGVVLARVYLALSPVLSGDLAWGAPAYELEVWLASALLGVTFPFLSFHVDFFRLWPLRLSEQRTERESPVSQPG